LPVLNNLHWRPAEAVFDILSALMLSTWGTKWPVITAKQIPGCAPGMLERRAHTYSEITMQSVL